MPRGDPEWSDQFLCVSTGSGAIPFNAIVSNQYALTAW